MREQIAYDNGAYWVKRTKKGYEVYRTGITHSVRCDTYEFRDQAENLRRAITAADKRKETGKPY